MGYALRRPRARGAQRRQSNGRTAGGGVHRTGRTDSSGRRIGRAHSIRNASCRTEATDGGEREAVSRAVTRDRWGIVRTAICAALLVTRVSPARVEGRPGQVEPDREISRLLDAGDFDRAE